MKQTLSRAGSEQQLGTDVSLGISEGDQCCGSVEGLLELWR